MAETQTIDAPDWDLADLFNGPGDPAIDREMSALAEQARSDTSRRTLSLTPGMPVDIFVDNGEPKRPIEIFFQPLEEVLDRALRGS